jgi:hypothetical protein
VRGDWSAFVPEGLSDSSLARSAWKCAAMNPSRRVRSELMPLIHNLGLQPCLRETMFGERANHTVRYGTGSR